MHFRKLAEAIGSLLARHWQTCPPFCLRAALCRFSLNESEVRDEPLSTELCAIAQGNVSSVSPKAFKQTVSTCAPQFSGYQQHDSQVCSPPTVLPLFASPCSLPWWSQCLCVLAGSPARLGTVCEIGNDELKHYHIYVCKTAEQA